MPSRTDFTFCSRLSGLTTGTTRSGCGMNGSTITRARARYSFGSRAITRAARTSTPNATTARVFQRRRTAAQSSSIVYVRSMFPLSFHPRPRPREPSLESRLFPDQSQLRHVAVHLVRGGQVIDPRIAQGSRLDPQIARELPGEPDGVAFIEQAAGGAVGSVRAPDRRADAEEELLAHTQVPLAARAGPPGVTSLGRKHVAVSRIVGSERQRLRVDSVVDLRPGAERVLDLAAESRDEDVTLAGSQEQPEAGDGEWILRIRRAAAELELVTRREMHARRQRTGLVRREGSAGKAELLRVREPGQSRLAIGGDVQVVLAEEIELDARHGLASSSISSASTTCTSPPIARRDWPGSRTRRSSAFPAEPSRRTRPVRWRRACIPRRVTSASSAAARRMRRIHSPSPASGCSCDPARVTS